MRKLSCFVVGILLTIICPVLTAQQFYLDGTPVTQDFMAFHGGYPLPILGVGKSTTGAWSGYVLSSDFTLSNGQKKYGPSSISPYQAPHGYAMNTLGNISGEQFTMTMNYDPYSDYSSLLTLWNNASTFAVPVDTLAIWRGGNPYIAYSYTTADAGGTYSLSPGSSVAFSALGSTCTLATYYEIYDEYLGYIQITNPEQTFNVSGDGNLPYWRLNGVNIAFGLNPTISYDRLVNGLGLTPGIYQLTLDLNCPLYGQDTATTSIQIIPEPASFLLLTLGFVWRRVRG